MFCGVVQSPELKMQTLCPAPNLKRYLVSMFNSLEISLKEPVSVEDIIDEVEDCDDESVKVDYEKDASWCRIEFRGRRETIHAEADKIRVSSAGDVSPADLIETFLSAHAQFFDTDS